MFADKSYIHTTSKISSETLFSPTLKKQLFSLFSSIFQDFHNPDFKQNLLRKLQQKKRFQSIIQKFNIIFAWKWIICAIQNHWHTWTLLSLQYLFGSIDHYTRKLPKLTSKISNENTPFPQDITIWQYVNTFGKTPINRRVFS